MAGLPYQFPNPMRYSQGWHVPMLLPPISALSCRWICDKMQAKLPRELRDAIYEYILGDEKIRVDCHGPHCACDRCHSNGLYLMGYYRPNENWWTNLTGHIHDAEYLGKPTLRELAEMWYRKSMFVFESCESLENFLRKDTWNAGLDSKMFLRRATLVIKRMELEGSTSSILRGTAVPIYNSPNTVSQVSSPNWSHNNPPSLVSNFVFHLRVLRDILRGTNVAVTIMFDAITWYSANSSEHLFAQALKLIAPELLLLQEIGIVHGFTIVNNRYAEAGKRMLREVGIEGVEFAKGWDGLAFFIPR